MNPLSFVYSIRPRWTCVIPPVQGEGRMFIVKPLRQGGITSSIITHPPVEECIARLEAMTYGVVTR